MQKQVVFVIAPDYPNRFGLLLPPNGDHVELLAAIESLQGIISRSKDNRYFHIEKDVTIEKIYPLVEKVLQIYLGNDCQITKDDFDHDASWQRFRKKMRSKGFEF